MKNKKEENKRERKGNRLLILLLLVVSISIGYAMLTTTLYINGTSTIEKPSWDVHYENLEKVSGSIVATEEATIDSTKADINYKISLEVPGDYYEFTVDIVNSGSLNAMIGEVLKLGLTDVEEKYVHYTVTYADGTPLREKDALKAGTEEKIRVKVKYRDDISNEEYPKETTELKLMFQVNYIQDDGTSNEV